MRRDYDREDPPLVMGGQRRDYDDLDTAAMVSWVLILFAFAAGMAVGAVVHGWMG